MKDEGINQNQRRICYSQKTNLESRIRSSPEFLAYNTEFDEVPWCKWKNNLKQTVMINRLELTKKGKIEN